MEQYKVIKKIKRNRHTIAKAGDVLIAKANYDRLWGVKELRKNDKYICDLGSLTAKEHCVKIG